MATQNHPTNTPVVLIIRDGWGLNPNPEHDAFNATVQAKTPVADMLWKDWPTTLVKTSGEDVGLPDGTMGNSEVGHQNIGAGRIVDQESVAITKACRAGLERNDVVRHAIERVRPSGGGGSAAGSHDRHLHLMGICSDAGVHGLLDHLYAILKAAKTLGVAHDRVLLHLFADGRDTGPFTGLGFARQVEAKCKELGIGRIASISGRYYAMDRDNRWERVKLAYDVLTGKSQGAGTFADVSAAIQDYYDKPTGRSQTGDEFITPRLVGAPAPIRSGDSVIFYNYRGDRPREISAAFVFPDDKWAKVKPSPDSGKNGFERGTKLDLEYVIMTEYWEELLPLTKVAFPKPPKMRRILGEFISTSGLRQFRSAETEKFPHVTFFFNDYRDEPFPGESREICQSPKVATYDLKPEMSAADVLAAVMRRLQASDCEDLIVVNFANGDMVGHTGSLPAAIKACETVDAAVGQIIDATLKRGGSLIVTADHGNCEQMYDPETKAPHTAHTVYDVPLHVVGAAFKARRLRGDTERAGWFKPEVRAGRGKLADIAPTIVEMMAMTKPAEMTGQSLLAR